MISLFQCRVMFGGAVIGGGEGRDEAVRGELPGDAGGPARDGGGDEDRGERRGVQADEMVSRANGVVEVGTQLRGLVYCSREGVAGLADPDSTPESSRTSGPAGGRRRIPHVSGGSLAWATLGRAGQDIDALLPALRPLIKGTTD
jgi:hypothetical protein